ncbi:hypothetical protein GWI33_011178 [Rhynchophorus ferrugineus]|uniref:Uncharacterized protein n=1 Tax=Rhynchophorus ferrugineus TaxID=354439 RepID=A0A834MBS1_RHYFE|nr:hypothetical protein GWI33_011178 [Rhynchophorus ferrugineus]
MFRITTNYITRYPPRSHATLRLIRAPLPSHRPAKLSQKPPFSDPDPDPNFGPFKIPHGRPWTIPRRPARRTVSAPFTCPPEKFSFSRNHSI